MTIIAADRNRPSHHEQQPRAASSCFPVPAPLTVGGSIWMKRDRVPVSSQPRASHPPRPDSSHPCAITDCLSNTNRVPTCGSGPRTVIAMLRRQAPKQRHECNRDYLCQTKAGGEPCSRERSLPSRDNKQERIPQTRHARSCVRRTVPEFPERRSGGRRARAATRSIGFGGGKPSQQNAARPVIKRASREAGSPGSGLPPTLPQTVAVPPPHLQTRSHC